MPKLARLVLVLGLAFGLAAAPALAADDYPSKPVQIIVPWDAGGGSDLIFRTAANLFPKYFSQPLVVVNKPGAAGTVGTLQVAKAKPDGYTLLNSQPGPLQLNPLQQKVQYALEDFELPVQLISTPQMLIASPGSPWKDAKEMIEYAKANPEKVRMGLVGYGNLLHLMTLKLQKLTGAKFTLVPFTGAAPARKEVMAGNIDAAMLTSEAGASVMDGSVKGLAITGTRRVPGLNVTTFEEQGIKGMVGGDSWIGVATPKGLDPKVRQKLVEVFQKISVDPDFVKVMEKMYLPVEFLGPEAMAKKVAESQAFFPAFLKETGVIK